MYKILHFDWLYSFSFYFLLEKYSYLINYGNGGDQFPHTHIYLFSDKKIQLFYAGPNKKSKSREQDYNFNETLNTHF